MDKVSTKVYIVNDGGHDYKDAARFGHLVFCTKGEVDRYDTSLMYRKLCAAMEDANADDYILLTSLSSLCSVACAMFAARFGRLNLLLFRNEQYVVRTLNFDNEDNDDDERSDSRGNR